MSAEPITDDREFWEIIDRARARKTIAARLKSIEQQLASPPNRRRLAEFLAIYMGWSMAVDRRDLWAAAATLLGGCGDDSFMDFRSWLILQGRDAIEQVVRDPDVLADWTITESPSAEGLFGIAGAICQDNFGTDVVDLDFTPVTDAWPKDRVADYSWTEEDCATWYPRIAAKPWWKRRSRAPRRPRVPKRSAYELAREQAQGAEQPYDRTRTYRERELIQHAMFRLGVVMAVRGAKIDVMFEDNVLRVLVHGG